MERKKRVIILAVLIILIFASSLVFISSLQYNGGKGVVDQFKNLRKGMSYDEMVNIVGEPDKDVGSGIYVYSYELPDDSEIIVGGFVGNGLLYVKQKMPNGTLVDIIE